MLGHDGGVQTASRLAPQLDFLPLQAQVDHQPNLQVVRYVRCLQRNAAIAVRKHLDEIITGDKGLSPTVQARISSAFSTISEATTSTVRASRHG